MPLKFPVASPILLYMIGINGGLSSSKTELK